MVIAVTGSTGFIGKALIEELKKSSSIEIIELNKSNGYDILNKEYLINNVKKFDKLIHLAAIH